MKRELLAILARKSQVSGQTLAEHFGISRAAIYKQIMQLRQMGLAVVAQKGQGYRLVHAIGLLDENEIRKTMPRKALARIARLEIFFELDSTNAELLRRENAPSGTVVMAEYQSAGRGRRGRSWQSPVAANFYCSLLWRFGEGLARLQGLSLAVAIALIRALKKCGVPQAMVKWPNDIVVGGKKLAGVLIEVGGEWNGPCRAAIGIGINVAMPESVARAIDQDWCDLRSMRPGIDRNHLAAEVLACLVDALGDFSQHGLAGFLREFELADALKGKAIRVHEGDARWDGMAEGINEFGQLAVRDGEGKLRHLGGGEISVRNLK